MEHNDILSTPDEIAEKLKVHKSWIYARTRETGPNSMPRVKVGKYIRFIEADVMNWIRQRSSEK